jgi:signal transduction histidine kinase
MHIMIWIIIWFLTLVLTYYFTQLRERKRIGSKLHNELANDFLVKVIWMKKKMKSEDPGNVLNSLIDEMELLAISIRQWSHDLYHNKKSTQTDYHLLIRKLVNNLVKPLEDCTVKINYQWKMEGINHSDREAKFIIQFITENLINAMKHSAANKIFIDLWEEEDCLYLQIEDNGVGFDLDVENKGIGRETLFLDAAKINATIVCVSGIGDGTTIRAKIIKKR